MRWLTAFIDDPDANVQRNARTMLRWLVANRTAAIQADQSSLNNIRRFADDPDTSAKSSAYIVYSLGLCGNPEEDYERVIRHAERVIEQDRERLDMVAESLYRMYPPALINAVTFFLDSTAKENSGQSRKQFATGMYLLEKVAEIDDAGFWRQYYDEMDAVVSRLAVFAKDNPAVERTVDQIEKHLALAYSDE
jgi:lipopolysaccharide biosynthesis regulator YciM